MAYKFKDGHLYVIEFDDHATGKEVIKCSVVGWIYKQDNKSITIASWVLIGVDKETQEANIECVTILKSTIRQYRKLL